MSRPGLVISELILVKRLVWVCVLAFWAASGAVAQTGGNPAPNATYALKIRGLTVGVIYLTSALDGRDYAVSGVIESTGLARMIRRFSYRGSARGAVRDGRLWPERYQETADTGRRNSEALIQYAGGVPQLLVYKSPKEAGPDSPDPATQGGTIDPLTAIFSLLRDVERTRACALEVTIFDGRRRSRISMQPLGTENGLPTCAGSYERLQGFTAKEVSRNTRFDFVLTYADAGGGMLSVQRVAFASSYGTASIDRR